MSPTGDQPNAIQKLARGLKTGAKHQTLLGVTGSGKTFTIASLIALAQKPTLIISPNKTLAWQLYEEFQEFFPGNAVHYFVSYYDYYQPEAYIPQTDTYIEKDARINETIDQMRHASAQGLLTRNDSIIVASVSCIYNLGSPQEYQNVSVNVRQGQQFSRRDFLRILVRLGYTRNEIDARPGTFSAKDERVIVRPSTGAETNTFHIARNICTRISSSASQNELEHIRIFPAHFWIAPENKLRLALANIRRELSERLKELRIRGNETEAERLERRALYDIELMEETGWCHGIENYSRHLEFRDAGSPPFSLIDYFSHVSTEFLTIIDESHLTIPQIRAMHEGDRARKQTLVEYGFRLPSAVDNRPLTFEEFDKRTNQRIYVSATPANYELHISDVVAEQIVRPTGLLDPSVEIRKTNGQMEDAVKEIRKRIAKKQRTLVLTITKRLAEDIADYLLRERIAVQYIHSEVRTLERPRILGDLRKGAYDVLVGVNLLREGLDLPETSLIIIFDADKEGFLRNETTLIQMMGRAARHEDGHVILYADELTGSMKRAIRETTRRRKLQKAHNESFGITPRSIHKKIRSLPDNFRVMARQSAEDTIETISRDELKRQMRKAAKLLDFEKAAALRDKLRKT